MVTKKQMEQAFKTHERTETLGSLNTAHRLAYRYYLERGLLAPARQYQKALAIK